MRKQCEWPLTAKPACGISHPWPSCPKILFALSVTTFSFGKTRSRSEANCSPTHSDTSQPVMSRSTLPCRGCRGRARASAFSWFVKAHAVIRLRLSPFSWSKSSAIRLRTDGRSARSRPTRSSFTRGGAGRPTDCRRGGEPAARAVCQRAAAPVDVGHRHQLPHPPAAAARTHPGHELRTTTADGGGRRCRRVVIIDGPLPAGLHRPRPARRAPRSGGGPTGVPPPRLAPHRGRFCTTRAAPAARALRPVALCRLKR